MCDPSKVTVLCTLDTLICSELKDKEPQVGLHVIMAVEVISLDGYEFYRVLSRFKLLLLVPSQ